MEGPEGGSQDQHVPDEPKLQSWGGQGDSSEGEEVTEV